jgi:Ras-related protein Rab-6A
METSSLKFKVSLIGSAQVGKTSLLRRIHNDEFAEAYVPTIGADFVSKTYEFNKKAVRYQFCDTAGEERYRPLIGSYVRDSDVLVAVYDITNASSFEDLKQILALHGEDPSRRVVVFLLGNKYDLSGGEERQVSADEVREYARENRYLFNEISVKSSINTGEILQVISEELLGRASPRESLVVQLPKLKSGSRPTSRNGEFRSNSSLLMTNQVYSARQEFDSRRHTSEVEFFFLCVLIE